MTDSKWETVQSALYRQVLGAVRECLKFADGNVKAVKGIVEAVVLPMKIHGFLDDFTVNAGMDARGIVQVDLHARLGDKSWTTSFVSAPERKILAGTF